MANVIEVRGVKIGEGVPKIIVPIVGVTKEEILAAAASFKEVRLDLVEWRVDWFEGVFDFAKVEDVLKDLRPALGDVPILFTFRTSKEGGEKAIEPEAYAELNIKASQTGLVDLIDVEIPTMISARHPKRMTLSADSARCRIWARISPRLPLCPKTRRMFWFSFPLPKRWQQIMRTAPSLPCPWPAQVLSAV